RCNERRKFFGPSVANFRHPIVGYSRQPVGELGTARQLRCGLTERDNLNEVRPLFNHPDSLLDVPERAYFSCVSNDRLMRTGVSVECVQIREREKVIENIDLHRGTRISVKSILTSRLPNLQALAVILVSAFSDETKRDGDELTSMHLWMKDVVFLQSYIAGPLHENR